MCAHFLADEHFPAGGVYVLRKLGHDVQTVRQLCQNKAGDGLTDAAVLQTATQTRRILLTYNANDFKKLHDECRSHFGIIACKLEANARAQAKRIDAFVRQLSSPSKLRGQFKWLPPQSGPQ